MTVLEWWRSYFSPSPLSPKPEVPSDPSSSESSSPDKRSGAFGDPLHLFFHDEIPTYLRRSFIKTGYRVGSIEELALVAASSTSESILKQRDRVLAAKKSLSEKYTNGTGCSTHRECLRTSWRFHNEVALFPSSIFIRCAIEDLIQSNSPY